jgi:hypothetical protein
VDGSIASRQLTQSPTARRELRLLQQFCVDGSIASRQLTQPPTARRELRLLQQFCVDGNIASRQLTQSPTARTELRLLQQFMRQSRKVPKKLFVACPGRTRWSNSFVHRVLKKGLFRSRTIFRLCSSSRNKMQDKRLQLCSEFPGLCQNDPTVRENVFMTDEAHPPKRVC